VWIEGKIGDVFSFSMTTKEENNSRATAAAAIVPSWGSKYVRKTMMIHFGDEQISINGKF
jgi:hypothetical protein